MSLCPNLFRISDLGFRILPVCLGLALPYTALGQGSSPYSTNGVEYAIAGALPGDQVHPHLSLKPSGGYLVWEDNLTDGYGLGVSALRLDSGFSGVLAPFRVNVTGPGDQNNPHVSMLNDGGAAFVWQGGPQGFQHIYARFLSNSNIWTTGEVLVNTSTNTYQITPVLATLANGNTVVAWASLNQAASNSLQDVYGQILSPSGQKVGGEFLINQFTTYNQRSPAIAALAAGGFAVTWVSEQERALDVAPTTNSPITYGQVSVDVFARIFTSSGAPATSEILVNTSSSLCSSPQVAAAADGTFMIVWAEQDRAHGQNGIDIFGRTFGGTGAVGPVRTINTTLYGDQYVPTISADNNDYLVAWTSLGQDGSYEGVFGQFLHYDGTRDGTEFQVNTTWISHQIHPVVASDGQGRFLSVWSSFIGGLNSYDLYAQRYVNTSLPLPAMNAPFVWVPFVLSNSVSGGKTISVYLPQLQISWPFQTGLSVDHYEVYVDGATTPIVSVTTNLWLMTAANGLAAGSTHSFQVDYVTTSGRRSPLSPAGYGTTWSGALNSGGIPSDWMAAYYGDDSAAWPNAKAPVAPGGPTLLQIFLTGADPFDPSTWLRTALTHTPQGYYLTWNPQPGLIYQVQSSSNLVSWASVGSPRFAAGTMDALYVGGGNVGYYRVLRLR
jgi:hypothetical protein